MSMILQLKNNKEASYLMAKHNAGGLAHSSLGQNAWEARQVVGMLYASVSSSAKGATPFMTINGVNR